MFLVILYYTKYKLINLSIYEGPTNIYDANIPTDILKILRST